MVMGMNTTAADIKSTIPALESVVAADRAALARAEQSGRASLIEVASYRLRASEGALREAVAA